MKTIQEVYPDYFRSPYDAPCDYYPLLASLGHEILLQVDDQDYQGDSRLLLRDGNRYGILIFCSGCDSLQACESYDEVAALRDRLAGDIKWFDDAAGCLEYVNTHNWEGDFSYNAKEMHEFLAKAKEMLAP